MPIQHGNQAPYAPAQAIIEVIEAYRDRGLTTPFSTEVLVRAGVTETLSTRVLASLKLLDLVDDNGQPTEQFDALKNARGEDYKVVLQEWLKATYADVLRYADPAIDSPDRVEEAFRGCEPPGQRGRMTMLMVRLWTYAGLIDEGRKPAASKPRSPRPTRPASPAGRFERPSNRPNRTLGAPKDIPIGLRGLLQQLPDEGQGWTRERRGAFLSAFEAVLDFTVPVLAEDQEDSS